MTTPAIRLAARRFRIWQYLNAAGYDVTTREVSEALDIPHGTVSRICKAAGWYSTMRSNMLADGARVGVIAGEYHEAARYVMRGLRPALAAE